MVIVIVSTYRWNNCSRSPIVVETIAQGAPIVFETIAQGTPITPIVFETIAQGGGGTTFLTSVSAFLGTPVG
jgi:hypothetical protein